MNTLRIRDREHLLQGVLLYLSGCAEWVGSSRPRARTRYSFEHEAENRHPVPHTRLECRARPDDGLEFSVLADSDELQQAGFAINCMNVPGAARISYLRFELDARARDTLNELGESVICEPGAALEIRSLRLAFGPVQGGVVSVVLDAVCHTRHEASIPVRAEFVARIVPDEPPAEPSAQPVLSL